MALEPVRTVEGRHGNQRTYVHIPKFGHPHQVLIPRIRMR